MLNDFNTINYYPYKINAEFNKEINYTFDDYDNIYKVIFKPFGKYNKLDKTYYNLAFLVKSPYHTEYGFNINNANNSYKVFATLANIFNHFYENYNAKGVILRFNNKINDLRVNEKLLSIYQYHLDSQYEFTYDKIVRDSITELVIKF